MTQESEPKGFFITPVQIFIAYAKKKDAEDAYPRTQEYHEKKWRLISGLFGIPEDLGLEKVAPDTPGKAMLGGLLSCRSAASSLRPVTPPLLGQWPSLDREIEKRHEGVIMRHAVALRSEYDTMGGELMVSLFPGIEKKHVSFSRLFELRLPQKAPDQCEDCWDWIDEHKDDEAFDKPSPPIPKDDMTPKQIDQLKLSEENHLRIERRIADEMDQIRLRVIEQGYATQENVDEIIYEMPVAQYLDLAADFPKISRVHFNPALKSQPK
jgi:hypothetical protein